MTKVWITKYALSGGIEERDAELCGNDMVAIRTPNGFINYIHKEGRDWHLSQAQALLRAEEMRAAKIASLKKQIAKLEKMKFEP